MSGTTSKQKEEYINKFNDTYFEDIENVLKFEQENNTLFGSMYDLFLTK